MSSDLEKNQKYAEVIASKVKLTCKPVAMKLIESEDDVPEGFELIDQKVRHCEMVRKASLGEKFYSTVEEQMCLGGAGAIGLRDMPEKLANGEKYFSLGRFQDLETAKKLTGKLSIIKDISWGIIYAPLDEADFEADVIQVITEPVGGMKLAQRIVYKTGEKINLQNKNPIEFNFNGFNNKVEKIILNIFKDISIADANGQRKYEISVPKLDKEEVREIKSFFKLYFGTIDNLDDLMTIVNDDENSKIAISIDVFNLMSKQRDKIYKEIDTALSQMEDGEEEYILYQISMYIKDKIKYTENHYNVNEALEDGEGVCNSYALLFKMMAERAGIITDVCLGYVEEGYHAWNRVQLKNGVYKYYDVTFYDGGKDLLYIGNAEGLHDLKAINVYLY